MHVKFLGLILFVLIFTSCKDKNDFLENNENPVEVTTGFYDTELMNKNTSLAINEGDSIAYGKLFRDYVSSGHYNNFICISIKMIEKHSFKKAYFDVYYLLTYGEYEEVFYKEELAYYFLVKAYELNDEYAKYTIEEINEFESSNRIVLDSEHYRKIILESNLSLPCNIKKILTK